MGKCCFAKIVVNEIFEAKYPFNGYMGYLVTPEAYDQGGYSYLGRLAWTRCGTCAEKGCSGGYPKIVGVKDLDYVEKLYILCIIIIISLKKWQR